MATDLRRVAMRRRRRRSRGRGLRGDIQPSRRRGIRLVRKTLPTSAQPGVAPGTHVGWLGSAARPNTQPAPWSKSGSRGKRRHQQPGFQSSYRTPAPTPAPLYGVPGYRLPPGDAAPLNAISCHHLSPRASKSASIGLNTRTTARPSRATNTLPYFIIAALHGAYNADCWQQFAVSGGGPFAAVVNSRYDGGTANSSTALQFSTEVLDAVFQRSAYTLRDPAGPPKSLPAVRNPFSGTVHR